MVLEPRELWKHVSPCVEVSTFGHKRVRGKIVDWTINDYRHSLHRKLAKEFIPNIMNKPEVHHIDCNPLNNHISNLMWVTSKENGSAAITRKRKSNSALGHISPNCKQIRVWKDDYSWIFPSVKEANRILIIDSAAVARGERIQSHGYYAEYIKEK